MTKITEQIAIVVGTQTAEGTVNANVRDATEVGVHENATTAVGVLTRDDSLTLDFERLEELGEDITGSLTKTAGTRLRESVTFSFDVTMKGPGTASPSAAGDFTLASGIENVFSGAGLNRGSETSTRTPYNLGSVSFLTFKVWRGLAQSFTLVDCKTSLSFGLEVGGSIPVTVEVVVGSVVENSSDTFPTTIDYGTQQSLAAPLLKVAGAQIGSVVRGQLDGTLDLENTFVEAPDSNAATGFVQEISERTVNYAGTFYGDDVDEDQDWQNLVQTSTPTDDIGFTLGVPGSDPANSIHFNLSNMNFTKVAVSQDEHNKVAWNLEGYATASGTTQNSEFTLVSL